MIVGFLNPIILLPDRTFDADELELIFRHELIHYKRGDLFIKLLSVIAVSLNWFNPAVYLMSAAMQADCEASCDEAVIADVGGESKQFYAEIVMDMIGSKRAGGTTLSTCFYGSKNGIKKRMEAIMDATGSVKKVAFSAIAVLALVIVFTGSIFAFAAQTPPEQPPQQQQQELQNQIIEQTFDNTGQQAVGQISSQTAREIAVYFVGYGTVHDIRAFTEDGQLKFEVEIRHDLVRYMVIINAENGSVTRMDTQPATPSYENQHRHNNNQGDEHNHNQSGGHGGGSQGGRPSNPAISLDRAIEIAYADIAARGINAAFRRDSGLSWERGQWVWELEFRTQGERMPIIEFYISADNGSIVKFEWDD